MINKFLLNLFLAAVYVILTGSLSFLNALLGFAIGFFIMAVIDRTTGRAVYVRRVWGMLRFAGYFLWILIKANLEVALEIMTPGFKMTPRIIRYPVDGLTAAEVTTLANAITLTPGTLSADIDDAGQTLYIHCMYAKDREQAVAGLDELRHALLREVFDHDI